MSADTRAIRVEQMAQTLARLGVDVSALVRDAYAEGYRDGLADQQQRDEHATDVDLVDRRPTTV